jgi:hypothetical protein
VADDPNVTPQPIVPASDPAVAAPAPSVALADLTAAGIPDTFIKDGALDAKALADSITEASTLKAAAEERAKLIPADGKYSFDLPKDFAAPAGQEWKPDATFTAEISALAKEQNLTQADVSKLTAAYATHLSRKLQADADAAKAGDDAIKADAVKVLGPNYLDVVANTRQAMQALFVEKIGKEAGERLVKNMGFQSASDIKDMTALINALNGSKLATNQGGAGNQINNGSAELVGKPGGGRKLLEAAHAAKT